MADAETRLRALEDRAELAELVAKYAAWVARGLGSQLPSLFARHGVFVGAEREIKGQADLAAFFANMSTPGSAIPMVTNMYFEIEGDTARGWASLVGHSAIPDKPLFSGRYEDAFVREDGAWKFARRDFFYFFGARKL